MKPCIYVEKSAPCYWQLKYYIIGLNSHSSQKHESRNKGEKKKKKALYVKDDTSLIQNHCLVFHSFSIYKHGMIECFGLEETLNLIKLQVPCHVQGHLPLGQVAMGEQLAHGLGTKEKG